MVLCDFCAARATICGDRRGRGAKTHGFLRFLRCSRDPLRGSAWSRCKNRWFFAISKSSRTTLCGDRRGQGAKTDGFLRFLTCSRDPLQGSAWSRCKNSRFFAISAVLAAGIGVVEVQKPWFFAISAVPAQPSAGIGVVEVQKLEVVCDFCCSSWSSGVVSWFARHFARLLPGRPVSGSIPPWSAGGRRKTQLAF